jgi:hypothetical protein
MKKFNFVKKKNYFLNNEKQKHFQYKKILNTIAYTYTNKKECELGIKILNNVKSLVVINLCLKLNFDFLNNEKLRLILNLYKSMELK